MSQIFFMPIVASNFLAHLAGINTELEDTLHMRNSYKSELVNRTRYIVQRRIQLLERRSYIHTLSLSNSNDRMQDESMRVISQNQKVLNILYLVLEKLNEDNVALLMSHLKKIGTDECVLTALFDDIQNER